MGSNELIISAPNFLVKLQIRSTAQTAALSVLVKNPANEERIIADMSAKQEGLLGGGAIVKRLLEDNGFRIVGLRMTKLSQSQAEGFYAVHRERPFYGSLVKFMTEGPVIVMALERYCIVVKADIREHEVHADAS